MRGETFRQVPVGIDAGSWVTVATRRTVLIALHNLTTLNRVLDIMELLDNDHRIQVVATSSGTDPFVNGLWEELDRRGIAIMPWQQAIHSRFDLIIAASHHGHLTELHGPMVIMPHGVGYTKYSPGTRDQGPGTRDQGPGTRDQGPGTVFGLSAQWLLHNGQPFARALVLSHSEQLDRLADSVPAALPSAVICGDPCFDRMRLSNRLRPRFRAALGMDRHRRLVVISSTWFRTSLLGSRPTLIRELMAELPYDSYQVALIAHPNIVAGHGEFQLRSWLADCLRAGLVIIPAIEGWQATIIAADCVIGDNGAVTTYAAALGRPTLLGAFPLDGVVPGTAVDQLGRDAPRLRSDSSLRKQIDDCMATWDPAVSARVRELVSSAPDEAAVRLRKLFYSILGLPEPAHEAAVSVLTAAGLPGGSGIHRPQASVVGHTIDHPTRTVRLTRYAAEIQPSGVQSAPPRHSHLVVGLDHPGRNMRQSADVIVDDLTGAEETTGLLDEYPGALIIALITGNRCLVRTRDGVIIEFTVTEQSVDLAAFASVAHCWLVEDLPVTALCPGIAVDLGGRRIWADVTVSDPMR